SSHILTHIIPPSPIISLLPPLSFFCTDPATTEIYTLSLHDALPILSVKADKQTVDDLTGVVDLQALDIKANADGLKLKANQDTVDLIDGRVSSLGTEVDAVAGQISSKVWNTDIESAIDGIEVGGRNIFTDSDMSNGISG